MTRLEKINCDLARTMVEYKNNTIVVGKRVTNRLDKLQLETLLILCTRILAILLL